MMAAWNIEPSLGEELRHFSSHPEEKCFKSSYQAVPQVKINASSDIVVSKLEQSVAAFQNIAGVLMQVLMVIVIVGFLFHILGSLSGHRGLHDHHASRTKRGSWAHGATLNGATTDLRFVHAPNSGHHNGKQFLHGNHFSHGSHPSNPQVIQRLLNEKTKLDKEKIGLAKDMEELMKADSDIDQKIKELSEATAWDSGSTAKEEIKEVMTSRYNHDYFCTLKRYRRTGDSGLAIDFILVGDRSLGNLQDPMASTIFWDSGSVHAAKHIYEVDDLQHEVVEGTLFFEGIPKGKTLDFAFGDFGYSKVRLPIVLDTAANSRHLARISS